MTASTIEVEPVYSRRQPAEWPGLEAFSRAELEASSEPDCPSSKVVMNVHEQVDKLGNEDLEANRYYGLGLIMCGVAWRLHDSGRRQVVIEDASEQLVQSWNDSLAPADGLHAAHLNSHVMGQAFREIAQEASNALPCATRLLIDAVVATASTRQNSLEQSEHVSRLSNRWITAIIQGRPGAKAVEDDIFTGTMLTLTCTLAQLHEYRQGRSGSVKAGVAEDGWEAAGLVVPVSEIATAEELRALDLRPIAFRLAALREDEFGNGVETYTSLDAEGQPVFHKERVSVPVGPPDPDFGILHAKRQKCPAMSVEGLIPMAFSVSVESIILAQHKIDTIVQARKR